MNALVVGGAHGIGLSIVKELVRQDKFDHIYVIGHSEFPNTFLSEKVSYQVCVMQLFP